MTSWKYIRMSLVQEQDHAKYSSLLHPDRSGALGRPSLDELARELGAAGNMEISASWGIINND
jgi:hypothetical protein